MLVFLCLERSRNHFSPVCLSSRARIGCLCAWKDGGSSFHLCCGPVELAQTCLCTGKDRKNSFHLCGGLVKLT